MAKTHVLVLSVDLMLMKFIRRIGRTQFTVTGRQTDWQTNTIKTKWKEEIKTRIKTICHIIVKYIVSYIFNLRFLIKKLELSL